MKTVINSLKCWRENLLFKFNRSFSALMLLSLTGYSLAVDLERMCEDQNAWKTVFNDSFDGKKLNTKIWRLETNDSTGGCNYALEAYNGQNVSVEDGHLELVAKAQWYVQPLGYKGVVQQCGGSSPTQRVARPYVSGKIDTYGKVAIDMGQPGRIDIRFKPSAGIGTWPAIWMFAINHTYNGGWSGTGEIDLVEEYRVPDDTPFAWFYNSPQPNLWFGGVCCGLLEPVFLSPTSYSIPNPLEFHTITFAWDSKGSFIWQIDGETHFKVTPTENLGSYGPNTPLVPNDYTLFGYPAGTNYPDFYYDPAVLFQPYVGVYSNYVDSSGHVVREPSPAPYVASNPFYLIIENQVGGGAIFDYITTPSSQTVYNAGNSVDLSNTPDGPLSDDAATVLGLPTRPNAFFTTGKQTLMIDYVKYSTRKQQKE
jgi:beta-glucanase (GH16 family)